MFDRWEYKIPANTAEKDAVKVSCPITRGFLRSLAVYFPPGCWNLARCRINVGERPIVPRSPSNYIAADGILVRVQYLNEPVQDDIPVLNWYVWNVDELHSHTIWMAAEWLSEERPYEMMLVHQMGEFIDLMRDVIGV